MGVWPLTLLGVAMFHHDTGLEAENSSRQAIGTPHSSDGF